ncbi:MAG: hypothetical protein V4556_00400 [Bacteroidota bacterium]
MDELWTDAELEKAIQAYFKMIKYEKESTPYIKAEVNRLLQKELPQRSHKSIEYRWQNISSVLHDKNMKFIDGFKPKKNVGSSVKERIWRIINNLNLINEE